MPAPVQRRLILEHIDEPGYTNDLACYQRHGGYAVLRQAVTRKPEELIDEEVERARPQTQGQRKLEAYLASERGRRAIRASLRRSLVVERLVDEWFDAHPSAWPTWAPERPATPTAAKASAK